MAQSYIGGSLTVAGHAATEAEKKTSKYEPILDRVLFGPRGLNSQIEEYIGSFWGRCPLRSQLRQRRGPLYDVLESPRFQTDDGQFDWVLRLIVHPRPDRPGDELCRDSVQIFLHLHTAPRDTAHLKCQFVFVRHSGTPKEDHTYQISRFREFRRGETWGFRRFIQRSTLFEAKNGFVQNDRLTVKINLDIIRGAKDEVQKSSQPAAIPRDDGLALSMAQLYRSRHFSDVVIVAQDMTELKAHRAILGSRSPVFEAMLSHDLAEKQSNVIKIDDVPKDVLEAFLSLIYTNTSPGLEEHAGSLLVLGEKYQISDVKEKAVDVLRKSLSIGNAGDLLVMADLHNVADLKEDVMDFIVKPDNWTTIRQTEAWIELRNANPYLLEELLDKVQSPKKMKTATGSSQR
ncbi:putative Speckle-type POZ protein [Hypsibius exemplaris]|uniref:Speckle-type POZ protein n=1 Tax=Hypsibius exemplaris TaxID=2072580 RepID=A0A1W0X318_HYPEX|nr:putative Speckle-type POZ protein [Hypsibius exemplaris]